MPSDDPRDEAVANALIWGGVAALGAKYPEAAVPANVAGGFVSTYAPQIVEQLKAGLLFVTARRRERVARVLVDAADRTGIPVDELLQRLAGDEKREQLLHRTLEAAAGTAMERWLPLYAIALRNGTLTEELGKFSWETMFVRVIGDLDAAHLQLLDRFNQTANELGLGMGHPDFDKPIGSLNEAQVNRVATDLPNHAALLAVLERHGLVARFTSRGGDFSGGPAMAAWRLTDFRRDVHARLLEVGGLLTP